MEHLFYNPLLLFADTVYIWICYSGWQRLLKDEKKDEGNEWVSYLFDSSPAAKNSEPILFRYNEAK
ncbi:MAG TPA: hypothetical protein VF622_18195 [Segetibacter sp.]